ncbi:MAG: DUF167 domain-containing protein [Aquabacterium sp.]|nr:DUF167 domain-containing protein [Aquabacterium sp.]
MPADATPQRPFMRGQPDGSVLLDLSVSPNARRTEAQGLHDGRLRVRLAAPPVDGKANEALLKWLAGELQVGRQQVTLVRGESARIKQVRLAVDPSRVEDWLQRLGC